jgi:uncharacterized protein (DUF885 family)
MQSRLGKATGVFTDPYQYFGELNAELWRAIRLVVDTGLHLPRAGPASRCWTTCTPIRPSKETRAVSEAERYMAIPGQALAYKIGQLKILELRRRAEQALGEEFDIREFHQQVLGQGDLPLDVLEERIDAWLAASRAETAAAPR